MTDRELGGTGVVLCATLVAALVVGALWRSVPDALPAATPSAPASNPVAGGPVRDGVRHVEILPGSRSEEIAQALDRSGIGDGSRFLTLVRSPALADLSDPLFAGIATLEGFVAPGIYDIGDDFSAELLVEQMTRRFSNWFTPRMHARAREIGLTIPEIVTLASIVEREVVFASEAPAVAAVYRTRLRIGMPLQADPTVIYALESIDPPRRYWTRGLSRAALRVESPYNTYRHRGLPPGPIGNPSRESILAVLYPASVDYRFFVARGNNLHRFSRTYREHLRNIERVGTRSRGTSDLQEIVERVLQPVDAHVGVVVKNLATGESATVNADEYFTAASLYKLAVLWKAFDERERGRLSFDEVLTITPDAAARDVPEVRARLGRRPTVAKALREMIVVSSNAAGITLLRRLGRERIDRFLRRNGFDATSLSSLRLVTTPQEVARFLELLANGRAVSAKSSREMVRIMLEQRIRDRLPRYLPKGLRLAHKTGDIDYPSHDAGILFSRRGPIVIVAMTESAKNGAKAAEAIAELGRVVYDYFHFYRPAADRVRANGRGGACPESPFAPSQRGPLSERTVVLDPGHGGTDPGARFRFPDGHILQEKEVVADVSLRLKDRLTALGATVHVTRCRDVFVNRMERAAVANAIKPDAVVSVHVNGSPKRLKDGTELYYFHASGRALASYLLGTFSRPAIWETLAGRFALPNRGVHRRQFDVLTFTLAPAALTEPVFMTHPAEARALRSTSRDPRTRREQIVRGHVRGLLNYFGVAPLESAPERAAVPQWRAPAGAFVEIAATGDIALRSMPLDGGSSVFEDVDDALAGDVVVGNLEGALAIGGESKCGPGASRSCFAFQAPPWYAFWLRRAGFTVLNLANNHSRDYGEEGLDQTQAALDEAGLLTTGRLGQIARQRIGAVRVATLGFAPGAGSASLLDVAGAKRLVRRADRWADVVVVTMHAGGEGVEWAHLARGPEVFLGEARGDPLAFAHAVVDAGADLVVGHGPHVLRGLEWYRGRLIAYSLGNFAGAGTLSTGGRLGLGAILRVRLGADGTWRRGRLVGVRLVDGGRPTQTAEAASVARSLSRDDFGAAAVGVAADGSIRPPGLPTPPAAAPPRLRVSQLSPREKAALLVVAGAPFPRDVGGILVNADSRRLPRPRTALAFADQEGGSVKAFTELPPWQPASAYTSAAWAFAEGRETGSALRAAGVHVDLAPVLDSPTGPLATRHFRHPAFAVGFARGVAAGGASPCVKHFPGLGLTPVSTDEAGPVRSGVPARDLAAFRRAVAARVGCVMVGHAVYPSLGPRPASIEPAVYRLLRRSGFRGVAITDDLAVLGRADAPRWARLAIRSGADLVLFTSGADAARAIEALVPLARRGELDEQVERVLRLRRSVGLPG